MKEVSPVKKLVLWTLALMMALSLCLPVCAAGEVTKYGNIGRLSKLNITEDELNEVLKDIRHAERSESAPVAGEYRTD